MREEGAADQVAHAARLLRACGLQIFEFEEDAAGEVSQHCKGCRRW